jgi:hypothetical protein
MAGETVETVGFSWSRVEQIFRQPKQCSNTHKPEGKRKLNYVKYLTKSTPYKQEDMLRTAYPRKT